MIIAICLALLAVLVGVLIFNASRRLARKNELNGRFNHFIQMENDKTEPREALEWLSYKLLGKPSIFGSQRHHDFILEDLGITQEQFRAMQIFCLRLWWKQLNLRTPSIKEACNGADYLESETNQLTKWMETVGVTEDVLVVDAKSVQNGYIERCCVVLEKGLYHYPDRAWHDFPAPLFRERLLEYWVNPEPERVTQWNEWVLAAKKRHAHRLLTRLRNGRYIFPESDERVTRLLVYLRKSGATLDDIGTDEDELEELRGFMYRPKKKKRN